MEEYLPCPHGRMPTGDSHGRQHCPHCLGLNNNIPVTVELPPEEGKWYDRYNKK